jgi:hypothetical protein
MASFSFSRLDNTSLLELFEDVDTDKIKNDERCRKYSAIFSIIIFIVRNPINGTKLTELLDIIDESVNVSNFEIVPATIVHSLLLPFDLNHSLRIKTLYNTDDQTCYPTYIQVQMHILQLQALRFFHLDWTNR